MTRGSLLLPLLLGACATPSHSTGAAPSPSAPPTATPATTAAPSIGAVASAAASTAPSAAAAGALTFAARPLPLPGATGAVSLDYLASDRTAGRVWIPAGGTGSVDVLDTAPGTMTRIEGFATAEREARGQKRVMGPSSATLGLGVVYVGNRATSEICAIDASKLVRGGCVKLASAPDGLQYVGATKEVWVTTPRDKSLTILDASTPLQPSAKGTMSLAGEPEGYGVDEAHGTFYTNLEDKDRTLQIDARTRRVTADWPAQCGSDGPRGLALDLARGFVLVACTDHVEVLDAAHGGALLSKLDTGGGVDNIDYLPASSRLYVAAGKAARLTVAHVDERGALSVVGSAPTADGARTVVVGADGAAYLVDPLHGAVLVLTPVH
jgi:hypothetical protein